MTLAARDTYKLLRNHPKWGFIIYRCDYRNDSAWKYFMDRWSHRVNEWLISKNERQLIETLEFTVKENRATLDGATVEDVRKLFTAWTKTDEAVAEQQAAIERQVWMSPRHTFCVHVDAESLDECLRYDGFDEVTQWQFLNENRDPALGQAAYVNIVEKAMPMSGTPQHDDGDDSEAEEDAISFKAHWPIVIPDIYNGLNQNPGMFQLWARDCDKDGVSLA